MKYKNLLVIPVYHARVNFTRIVFKKFMEFKPDCVVVEFPRDLEENTIEAIERLPLLSIVGYQENDNIPEAHVIKVNKDNNDEPVGGDEKQDKFDLIFNPKYTYIPVHPADPMIEGIRLALQYKVPIAFIDLILDDYDPRSFRLPDDELIDIVEKLESFPDLVLSHIPKSEVNSVDYDRELCMASRLQDLMDEHERVLFITGFAHWERIKDFLDEEKRIEVTEIRYHENQAIFNVHPISSDLVIEEIPYLEYLYELWRMMQFGDVKRESIIKEITKHKFKFFKLNEQFLSKKENTGDTEETIESTSNGEIEEQQVDDRWLTILYKNTELEVDLMESGEYSRKDGLSLLLECANMIYQEYYFREPVTLLKLKFMMQYMRNWSILKDAFFPNLYKVAMSAKNFVNDEYASIVLDIARLYPFIEEHSKYPTVIHDAGDNFLGPNNIFLKSRISSGKRSWIHLPIKKRPKERFPGEWQKAWKDLPYSMCSYQPEDIIEENFFTYLRQKTLSIIENKRVKIKEFKNSLLDGIDFRETIRNKIIGKLYVKEILPIFGKVGSVVIIFDPDEERHIYENKVTWWAEHNQESDMAFYSTFPEENLIGPGIARVELGGVLSIYPPMKIPDVWHYFPVENETFKKCEILLRAAIHFSKEKFIPYVSGTPPSKKMEKIALSMNKIIIHIPLWNLSKETLESVRFLHMLRNKSVRGYAKDFIFL
ncbi:MAG: hypothetical protein ACFFCS_06930 [Candidatus Hodarchaeota archaeon]